MGGRNNLPLSRLNFGGLSPKLMTGMMKAKNVATLEELFEAAKELGVGFVACEMAMHILELKKEDLVDEVARNDRRIDVPRSIPGRKNHLHLRALIMAKTLDITRDCCPMTFVKVKLALAKLQSGEELDVLLNEGEPLNNVPRTVTEQGHQVLSIRQEGSFHHVLIRKA